MAQFPPKSVSLREIHPLHKARPLRQDSGGMCHISSREAVTGPAGTEILREYLKSLLAELCYRLAIKKRAGMFAFLSSKAKSILCRGIAQNLRTKEIAVNRFESRWLVFVMWGFQPFYSPDPSQSKSPWLLAYSRNGSKRVHPSVPRNTHIVFIVSFLVAI